MSSSSNNNFAFTLIELMVVIVIIGIISAIAIPNYKSYITKSKMAEAYGISDVITKSQIKHFDEFNEFVLAINGAGVHQKNPNSFTQPNAFIETASWDNLGYPVPVGSSTQFLYMVIAGKYDETGTEVGVSATTGNSFSNINAGRVFAGAYAGSTNTCNNLGTLTSVLGLSAAPNYNFAVISAVADLNGDQGSLCTGIVKIIESSDSTGGKPGSNRGFIIFHEGN